MGPEIVIPVSIFGSIVGVVWMFQHFAAKKRLESYKTLQLAIEKGQPLTPDALEAMARMSSPLADLKRGIVFIAIAAGFAAFATIIGTGNFHDDDMQAIMRGLYGVAMFPLFVGLAFLGIHFFANESKRR
ncbi:MAG TPA: DUF6249 domain-containing protein [Hyphomonadaceae bacterium]|nr:DUF6249 domain-containing protein [Hyphomonadaceae bacterium]